MTLNDRRLVAGAACVVLAFVTFTGCQQQTDGTQKTEVITKTITVDGEVVEVTRIVTELVEVVDAPSPDRSLVICMSQEPQTLYWHARRSLPEKAILHALYAQPYRFLSYAYQAEALVKVPSLADGDAAIRPVAVPAGERVVDADGRVVSLADGVTVRTAAGEIVTYAGNDAVLLEQMVVDFTFRPLTWADGVPVTSGDSVFSFDLAADPATPADDDRVERTARYEAIGPHTVRWTGLPGWRDDTYFRNVWMPLPRHAWEGLTPAGVQEATALTRRPLGHGPFQVDEWVPGERITLVPNAYYTLGGDDLPRLDAVTIRFVPDPNQMVAQLLAGQCDVATQDALGLEQVPALLEAEAQGVLSPHFQTGMVYEHLDFGIDPSAAYATTRPDWFADTRVRQAIALCTDRQRMVDEILYGQVAVMDSYVPRSHPLHVDDGLAQWPYDPAGGNALLDEVGFVDGDGDGIREYYGPAGHFAGTPFAVRLLTTEGSTLRQKTAAILQENLAGCGVAVQVEELPTEALFARGPEGPLFGRRFDLALFAWLAGFEPSCGYYRTGTRPGPGNGWWGQNATGFSDEVYDAACRRALEALPGTDAYVANHGEAQRRFAAQVPALPLFPRLKVAATRPGVRNFHLDPTEETELWNLREIDLGDE